MTTFRPAALYVQVSTRDRGQTVDNQLQPLGEAARWLGWTVVALFRDEGISGARGRDKRPGLAGCALEGRPFGTASYKRSFLGEPQIGSDYVLKPAVQRPRTQS
jgi:hypothetical protein